MRASAVIAQGAQRIVVGIAYREVVGDMVLGQSTDRIGVTIHGTQPELLEEEEIRAEVEAERCTVHGFHQEGRLELVVSTQVEDIPTSEEVVCTLAWRGDESEGIGVEEFRADQFRGAETEEVPITVIHHTETELRIELGAHVLLEHLITLGLRGKTGKLTLEEVHSTFQTEGQLLISHEDPVCHIGHEGVLGDGPMAIAHDRTTHCKCFMQYGSVYRKGLRRWRTAEAHPLVPGESLQAHPLCTTRIRRIDGEQVEHVLGELRILLREERGAQEKRERSSFPSFGLCLHYLLNLSCLPCGGLIGAGR